MSVFGRILSFGAGGALGAAVGAVVAQAMATQSGEELKRRVRERVDSVKAIGDAAAAEAEGELIQKFRSETADPMALSSDAERVSVQRLRAMEALGLGLNAQGAISAQQNQGVDGDPLGPLPRRDPVRD
jgi:gas vesicle protein